MKITTERCVGLDNRKDRIYVNLDDVITAMNTLNKNGRTLWLYFLKNKYKTLIDDDHLNVCEKTGLSYDAYNDGINNMIKKGYAERVAKNVYKITTPQ